MTNQSNPADENSNPQTPNQLNWNINSFGLNPFYIWEKIKAGFTKTFSHMFGWDPNNLIWRPLSTDSNGNMRVSNGTQSSNAPLQKLITLDTTHKVILNYNPSRSGFTIQNNAIDDTYYSREVLISYPNLSEDIQVIIPAGYAYTDNNWQGTVTAFINASGINVNVIVIEI